MDSRPLYKAGATTGEDISDQALDLTGGFYSPAHSLTFCDWTYNIICCFCSLDDRIPSSIMYQLLLATCLVCFASAAVRLDETCSDHGQFACHKVDPTSFTRCLEGQLYEFYCPDGLHFNTQTQTCDWPESADCTYILSSTSDSSESITEPASKEKVSKVVQKAAGGKSNKFPWWRPKNVDPSSWEDTSNLLDTSGSQSGGSKDHGHSHRNVASSTGDSGSSTSGESSGGTSGGSSGEASSSGGSSTGSSGSSWESSAEETGSAGTDSSESQQGGSSSGNEGVSESASGSQPQGHQHPHGNAISSSADRRPDFGSVPWNSGGRDFN